ncbi:MAG: radical SAM protein [Candidatus Glassbacteria bacterium]|nr:radical SAM protein [Candidatus Glassbacteria bacterium]
MRTMKVCETFCSIAGESSWQGLTATFVRFAGCDVACSWCDTEYARSEEGTEVGVEDILSICRAQGGPRVVLTGGEPLLQQDLPELCLRLCDEGYLVQVETSGTRLVDQLDKRVLKVVDIKPPSAEAARGFHWGNLDLLGPEDEIKFLVADRRDYDWALKIIDKCSLQGKHKILFSPVAGRLKPSELAEWMIRDRLPYRLQLQLHKVIWPGESRGR